MCGLQSLQWLSWSWFFLALFLWFLFVQSLVGFSSIASFSTTFIDWDRLWTVTDGVRDRNLPPSPASDWDWPVPSRADDEVCNWGLPSSPSSDWDWPVPSGSDRVCEWELPPSASSDGVCDLDLPSSPGSDWVCDLDLPSSPGSDWDWPVPSGCDEVCEWELPSSPSFNGGPGIFQLWWSLWLRFASVSWLWWRLRLGYVSCSLCVYCHAGSFLHTRHIWVLPFAGNCST